MGWVAPGRYHDKLMHSFSKSIAPGLRVGWVAPGRYHDKLMHMKYAISSFNVPSTQMAAATFVLEGHYHRHIRRMRQIYQRNLAAPGRYHDKLMHMKYAISSFNVPSTQMAAATFVLEGHYHRHIRRMRQIYQRNLALYTCWIREYFPCEICITRPKGGFLLWKADFYCGSNCLNRSIWSASRGSCTA